jgi:hypothetical protein
MILARRRVLLFISLSNKRRNNMNRSHFGISIALCVFLVALLMTSSPAVADDTDKSICRADFVLQSERIRMRRAFERTSCKTRSPSDLDANMCNTSILFSQRRKY